MKLLWIWIWPPGLFWLILIWIWIWPPGLFWLAYRTRSKLDKILEKKKERNNSRTHVLHFIRYNKKVHIVFFHCINSQACLTIRDTGGGTNLPRTKELFSIAIQIWWKFRFTITSTLIPWSLQNFVHGTVVACAKICCDLMASNGVIARRSFHRIWIWGKKPLVKRAPAQNKGTLQKLTFCS